MVKQPLLMEKIKSKIFNHLKVHSQYSICEGAIKIEDLRDYCKKNKIKSLGISDTSNLSAALEFSENLSKSGTQPIIGTQVNFKFKNEIGLIPLIAKNEQGYKNIISLSSKSYLLNNSLSDPHCDIDDILKFNEGIIIFSGTVNGLFGKLFNKGKISEIEKIYKTLSNAYKENFYIEIQRHNDLNEKKFEELNLNISGKYDIPIIATNEVFYIDKSYHEAHDALVCIGSKSYVNDKNRLIYSDQHYLKSSEEMEIIFKDLPEALENNYNLPLRCNYRTLPSKPILPNISTKAEGDADKMLSRNSIDGLKNKFKNIFNLSDDKINKSNKYNLYKKRLDHELDIIIRMKYSSYFLIVSDYIKWSKKNDIPVGPGRGSGAGSLVAWCLEITNVDPIKFNLIFERFLNPDRISMPDFDIDFCEEKRDLVLKYLSKKYPESVAHIITFGKLKARMVIRDVGRVIGLPYGFVDSISKMIPFDPSRPQTLSECIGSEPRLQKLIQDDKRVKKLIDLSLKLEGLNRNVATHAAGVVIADKKLSESIPLYKDASADLFLPSTQFDMYSAENAGLIKFDFLGLKTLTVINKTQKLIKKNNADFNIEDINYSDQKVFEYLSSGNTVGLFQLESAGMREALIEMKPNHLEDIIALVALYRPGPMSNIQTYNDCKHKRKDPDYIHPMLEEILKPTYGVIIYQEQVMQIAQKLSSFTAGEADILRKAIGKKKRAEVEKQKERFINGAVKNGIRKDVAAGIFLKIEPFAEYGFNKSHAAAYGIIAYQTAYLKTYYPNEFFSASMTMDISNQNKLSEFYEELKRLKINIVRPDINLSNSDFYSKNGSFYYALGGIKNVGYEAITNIVEERIKNGQYRSIKDFINRTDPKNINKLQLEGLVKAGAFDKLCSNRNLIYSSIPNLIIKSKNIFENKSTNQKDLFGNDDLNNNENFLIKDIKDWSFEDKLRKEFESIGFFISDHPLSQFKDMYDQYNIKNYSEFKILDNSKETNIAGTLLKIQEKKTQKGNSYAIIKLTDLTSVFELFIFSDILDLNRDLLIEGNSLLLTVAKNLADQGNRFTRVNVKKITSLKNLYNQNINEVIFEIDNIDKIEILSDIINEKGKTEVSIYIKNNNEKFTFKLKNKRNVDRKLINLIKNKNISAYFT